MKTNLHIFDTPEETARAVAILIMESVKKKVKQSLPFNIALSGGNTPNLLFNILANEFTDSIPWHFVRLFWVDERCVPPTNKESNFGMAYDNLLKLVSIQETNIFRMQGENDPQTEAIRYQELLEQELPIQDGFPQFDLVLLGMGDDGHTASIFPNDLSLLNSDLAVEVGVHPVTGQKRITLTGPTIRQATNVIFFITGSSKSKIISKIIQQKNPYLDYPASHVNSQKGITYFYLDNEAAQKLAPKFKKIQPNF